MLEKVIIYEKDLNSNFINFIKLIRGSPVFCDIETTGLDPIKDKITLFQIKVEKWSTYIVKIEEDIIPQTICNLIENPLISKVFHHAPFDVSFMINKWNIKPESIYCTRVQAKLLGEEKRSLKDLVKKYVGISIDKTLQTSDWSDIKSLSKEQISYLINDVEYLPIIYKTQKNLLCERGLNDLYEKIMDFMPTYCKLKHMGHSRIFERENG